MKDIWNRLAYNPRRHGDRDVEFADLENFTEKETVLITDPIFSRDALDSFMDKAQRSDHRKRQVKTYATKTDITGEEGKCQSPCHMCKKNHDMDKLKKFLELSVNERSRYFAKNKICFGCYDPISSNHSAKICSNRIICKECKNYHPTTLHGYQYKKQNNEPGKNNDGKKEETQFSNRCTKIEDFSNPSINQETSMVSMCVVPLIVKHKNSSREMKTFAMLDNCSQGNFIKEDLLKELKIGGRVTSISIKTLNGENIFQSHVNDGLQVYSSYAKSMLKAESSNNIHTKSASSRYK